MDKFIPELRLIKPPRPDRKLFQYVILVIVFCSVITSTIHKKASIVGGLLAVSSVLLVHRLSVRDYKEWLNYQRISLRQKRRDRHGEKSFFKLYSKKCIDKVDSNSL